MKHLALVIISFAILLNSACTKEKVIRQEGRLEATGKSNGGDNIAIEKGMIEQKIKDLKPLLHTLFSGLRDQAKAETLVPSSTDLEGHPELVEIILRMSHFGKDDKKVFDDIDTPDNFLVQEQACQDYSGNDHLAATNLLEVGGEICFSLNEISTGLPADSEKSFDIQVLALAAHEFFHHFYSSGVKEKDEVLATLFQQFIVYQLHKFSEFDEDIVATNSMGYLTRFSEESNRLLKRSRQAHQIQGEEEDQLLQQKHGNPTHE